jgi:hypothetical protein
MLRAIPSTDKSTNICAKVSVRYKSELHESVYWQSVKREHVKMSNRNVIC